MPTPSLVQSKSGTITSGTSLTITLTLGTTAGNCLVVYVGERQATTNPAVSGITLGGSAGNFAAAKTVINNANYNCEIWVDWNCAGGQTSVVITFTAGSGGSQGNAAWVEEWSGIQNTSSPVDKTNGGNGDSTSPSSGSTGTLTSANELVVGAIAGGATITGPGSPWTNQSQVTAGPVNFIAGHQAVTATTAQTYSGTIGTSAFWGAAVVSLTAASGTTHSGTASLTGTGTLTTAWAYEGAAVLSGKGTLGGTTGVYPGTALYPSSMLYPGFGLIAEVTSGSTAASLSGSGTLTSAGALTYEAAAALSGTGSLTAVSTGFTAAALSGSGTITLVRSREYGTALTGQGALAVSGEVLGFSGRLTGTGTLGVARVLGVVTAGASRGVTTIPYAWPGSSQVAVSAPGSSRLYWLGTLGQITALTYSYACPGGCDKLTCTVMVPASYRTSLFNPGWQVQVFRGGHRVWAGKLDEPQPTAQGWNITATGAGNLGQDYVATYTDTWPANQPDESISNAIGRGLPWVNPGVGQPSGAWFGQAVDSGGQTITALLNLVCTRGGLTWYVNSQPGGMPGNSLSVFPLPTTPNRLLVCTTPVARTLGGDLNSIFIRYEISADTTDGSGNSIPATYGLVEVQNSVSVAAHQSTEVYVDLSDAGVMTTAQAEQVGTYILEIYQRVSFAGPLTVRYGELLNAGGQPVDIGTDQAGTVCRAIFTDLALGGEVIPGLVSFIVGAYSYDDFQQVATVTPYQTLNENLSSLLSMQNTLLVPIQAASG